MTILDRSFFERPTLDVARDLIGAWLVHDLPTGRRSGRIVETEAYIHEDDQAAHCRIGRTVRNAPMYGPGGTLYVYLIYGKYHCLNLATEPAGTPAAVLIRAIEPGEGVTPATNGPGRLCQALAIDRTLTGSDGTRPPLYIEDGPTPSVTTTPRIGVDYAGAWAALPWRFVDPASPSLSRRLKL